MSLLPCLRQGSSVGMSLLRPLQGDVLGSWGKGGRGDLGGLALWWHVETVKGVRAGLALDGGRGRALAAGFHVHWD